MYMYIYFYKRKCMCMCICVCYRVCICTCTNNTHDHHTHNHHMTTAACLVELHSEPLPLMNFKCFRRVVNSHVSTTRKNGHVVCVVGLCFHCS